MRPKSSSELSLSAGEEEGDMNIKMFENGLEDNSPVLNRSGDCKLEDDYTDNSRKTKFPWDTEKADISIKVENFLFPVQSMFVSQHSSVLRKQIQLKREDSKDSVLIENSSPIEMRELLTFIYHPRKKVDDSNVLSALYIAEKFQVSKLKTKCEQYIVKNKQYFRPMDLLHTAATYNLTKLMDYAVQEVSKMPAFERFGDFRELDACIQQRVIETAKRKTSNVGYSVTLCNSTNSNDSITPDVIVELNTICTDVQRPDVEVESNSRTEIYYKRENSQSTCDSDSESDDEDYDADSEEGFSDDESANKRSRVENCCCRENSSKDPKCGRLSPSKLMKKSKTFLRKVFKTSKSHTIS